MRELDEIEKIIERVKGGWKIIVKSVMWILVWQTINTILIAILFFMVWGLYQ